MQGLGFAAVRDLISFLQYDERHVIRCGRPTASRPSPGPTASASRRAAVSCGTSSIWASTPTSRAARSSTA